MSEPFIGQIIIVGFSFPPRGYALCNGQILSIAQNTALFSLLGTTYGGNGQTTFALPNLQSRVPIHFGQGPGLSSYSLGQQAGEENHTLISNEMPQHNHVLNCHSEDGNQGNPNPHLLATAGGTPPPYSNQAADAQMAGNSIGLAGGSQPHNNIQPYLALNFCIALQGIFPSRN